MSQDGGTHLFKAASSLPIPALPMTTPRKTAIVPNGGEVVFMGYRSLCNRGMVQKVQGTGQHVRAGYCCISVQSAEK